MILGGVTKLNLIPSSLRPTVRVNETDSGCDLQFRIYNGTVPYNVPEGITATVRGTKGDGNGYAAEATTQTGSNLVVVALTEQMTAVAGIHNIFEIVFADSNGLRVGTANFVLAVEKAALNGDTVISDSDIAYAEQVLNQLQSVASVNAQVQQNKADIALEASARASADATLQTEIDQIIAPSGEAPSAAEVQNARIGADGVTYPTLGDAIRTNDSLLKSQLEHDVFESAESGEYLYQTISQMFTDGSVASGVPYPPDGNKIRITPADAYNTFYVKFLREDNIFFDASLNIGTFIIGQISNVTSIEHEGDTLAFTGSNPIRYRITSENIPTENSKIHVGANDTIMIGISSSISPDTVRVYYGEKQGIDRTLLNDNIKLNNTQIQQVTTVIQTEAASEVERRVFNPKGYSQKTVAELFADGQHPGVVYPPSDNFINISHEGQTYYTYYAKFTKSEDIFFADTLNIGIVIIGQISNVTSITTTSVNDMLFTGSNPTRHRFAESETPTEANKLHINANDTILISLSINVNPSDVIVYYGDNTTESVLKNNILLNNAQILQAKSSIEEIKSSFYENMSIRYYRDVNANTNYSITQIFKKKIDGTYQYPFIRAVDSTADRKSAYELARLEGWKLVINGGGWEGPIIENSVLKTDAAPYYQTGGCMITVDSNGDLGYVPDVVGGEGASLINQGIVSAFYHFFPIVVNYEDYDYPTDIPDTFGNHNWEIAQKQILGQYENGDYCIITAEGRGFANSVGFTVPQIQTLCKNIGLKFAYHLDGGGSTQTVLGEKNVNHIYEGTTGRVLPAFIVFNGADTFSIPNS